MWNSVFDAILFLKILFDKILSNEMKFIYHKGS